MSVCNRCRRWVTRVDFRQCDVKKVSEIKKLTGFPVSAEILSDTFTFRCYDIRRKSHGPRPQSMLGCP
ncbi:hypothetical protein PLUA15_280031 [Pseudomonas lundensis]|uniref:Uncharacterized protein n=1 Tax=Pseudomonas lundensis TaxID=86185 RepID=A0AAX2HBX7_9PSED|nr:hypothetical protein PLUA15_280031 [Pseudomonas lundensis]